MSSVRELKSVLDHGAVDRTVGEEQLESQLRTAAALKPRLDRFGGAILGDEVGTGKTFVSFALLAQALIEHPNRGCVILVPTELLERKWEEQLRSYLSTAVRDRKLGERLARRIVRVNRSLRNAATGRPIKSNAVAIGRHSLFAYKVARSDLAIAIEAYLQSRTDLRRRPTKRFMEACGVSRDDAAPWYARWADPDLFAKHPRLVEPLGEPFERWRDGERDIEWQVSEAIHEVRRRVGRRVLPESSLMIVDEAHNLRSTGSQVYSSLMRTLAGKFDSLLFLTATPFQLGRWELRNIVEFFRGSRRHADVANCFELAVQSMEASMDGYVAALDLFGGGWRSLDEEQTARTVELIKGARTDPVVDAVPAGIARQFSVCLEAKAKLEHGLGPLLVRSVRERFHDEQAGMNAESVDGSSRIPLALVDRMLYELFRDSGRTFVASICQGACSSWDALFTSRVMDQERAEGDVTRRQLLALQKAAALGPHPKVRATVDFCLQGIAGGEKTLVFVERVKTGERLHDDLLGHLEEAEGTDDAKDELQKRARFGWPSLRENYLHTVFPLVFGQSPDSRRLEELAQKNTALFEWADTGRGTDRDYAVEKRFWEHVFVLEAVTANRRWHRGLAPALRETVERLTSPDYVLNGLDLESGSTGETLREPTGQRGDAPRAPRLEFARAYLAYPSPWASHGNELASIPPCWRANFVDHVASAIARSHFRHELAALSSEGDPARHFEQIGLLLTDFDRGWPRRFAALVEQMVSAARDPETQAAEDRVNGLLGGLRSSQRVQFVGPSSKGETRYRAVAGFNTPLYSDILIATPVLSEGIDLHRSCRRVVHHDLPWNPAKLEQRTGRIDRVGSLNERLRADGRGSTIEVFLPFMDGTYDQFIYTRVMARRREFRCLLGSPPEWEGDELAEEDRGEPMAAELVERLQVRLGA